MGKSKICLCEEDMELVNNMCDERNLKENTHRGFITIIKKYLYWQENKYTMTELLEQARKEQEQGTPPQYSKLYTKLTNFRIYLSQELSPRTVKMYMIKIREVYRHYDIIVPQLKPFQMKLPPPVTYDDLPSKEELRKAVSMALSDFKALILFQSSSGTALKESMSLTVGMFIKGCEEYLDGIDNKNVEFLLLKLKKEESIVPIIQLERIKTNKYYYTCCSPEASRSIIEYLLSRIRNGEKLSFDSHLWHNNKHTYTKQYSDMNQKLGLGFVGYYGKFRSHALRKFHASNLDASVELIDELQGRGKSTVHEAYIKDRPQKIKQEYMKYMKNVMLYHSSDQDNMIEEVNDSSRGVSHGIITQESKEEQCMENNPKNTHDNWNIIYKLIQQVAVLEHRIDILEKQQGG